MEWALAEIKKIQTAARSGKPIVKPRWPVIIMRTPKVSTSSYSQLGTNAHRIFINKGMSGPKELRGDFIEGSFHSHQVPLPAAKTDKVELDALQAWLSSYKPQELFHLKGSEDSLQDGRPVDEVLSVIPELKEKKLGQKRESYAAFEALKIPEWIERGVERGGQESCMKLVGKFLKEVIKQCVHPHSTYASTDLVHSF